MYGGLDTIRSNFLLNICSKDLFKNFILLDKSCFKAFFFATKIAFFDISIPTPEEFIRLDKILITIHPEPVPISRIKIFFLYNLQ